MFNYLPRSGASDIASARANHEVLLLRNTNLNRVPSRLCARLEGMITDPVYEGKSMQGMIDLVNKGYFPKGSKVLYAHLGGAPAINGYAYTFRNG